MVRWHPSKNACLDSLDFLYEKLEGFASVEILAHIDGVRDFVANTSDEVK